MMPTICFSRLTKSNQLIEYVNLSRFRPFFSSSTLIPFSNDTNNSNSNSKVSNNRGKHHRERRLVKYPIHHVYNVIADVQKYETFVPWCKRSTIVSSKPDKEMNAELEVGFNLLSEKYMSKVTLTPPLVVVAESSQTNLFEYLRSEWRLNSSSDDPNCTWINFQIEFKFRLSIYNEVSELFMNEVVKKMVQAFEDQCKKRAIGPSPYSNNKN